MTTRLASITRRARPAAAALAAVGVLASPLLAGTASAAPGDPVAKTGHWVGQGPGFDITIDEANSVTIAALAQWVSFGGTTRPTGGFPAPFDTSQQFSTAAGSGLPAPSTSPYADGGQIAKVFCIEFGTTFPQDPNVTFTPVPYSQARGVATTPPPGTQAGYASNAAERLERAAWLSKNAATAGTPIANGDPGIADATTAERAENVAIQLAVWVLVNDISLANLPAAQPYGTIRDRANALVAASAGQHTPDPAVAPALSVEVVAGATAGNSAVKVTLTEGFSDTAAAGENVTVRIAGMPDQVLVTGADGSAATAEFPTPAADTAVTAEYATDVVYEAGTVLDAGSDPSGAPYQQTITASPVTVAVQVAEQTVIPGVATPPTTTTTAPPTTPTTIDGTATTLPGTPPTTTARPPAQTLPYTGGLMTGVLIVLAAGAGLGGIMVLRRTREGASS